MPNQIPRIVVYIFLAVFCFTLLCFTQRHFHPDELYWQGMNASRMFSGEWFYRHYFLQCVANYETPIPFSLIPGRLIASLFNPSSMTMMLIHRVIIYLMMIGTLTLIAIRLIPNQKKFTLLIMVTALSTLGFMPFRLISLRPEIFIAVQFFILIILYLWANSAYAIKNRLLWNIVFLLIASLFLGNHPKVMLFIPSLLVLAAIMPNKRSMRAMMVGLTLLMSVQSYHAWMNSVDCPDDQYVREWTFDKHALFLSDLINEPLDSLDRIIKNFYRFEGRNIINNSYSRPYKNLPVNDALDIADSDNRLIFQTQHKLLIAIIIFIIFSYSYATLSLTFFTPKERRLWLLKSIILLPLLGFISSSESLPYDAALIWPLIFALVIASCRWLVSFPLIKKYFVICVVVLAYVSALNQITFIYHTLPQALYRLTSNELPPDADYIWGASPAYAIDAQMETMQTLAKQCDITLARTTQHLMIDDATYTAALPTKNFIHHAYFLKVPNINDVMKEWKPNGVLTSCIKIPDVFKPYAKRMGPFCCTSAKDVELIVSDEKKLRPVCHPDPIDFIRN